MDDEQLAEWIGTINTNIASIKSEIKKLNGIKTRIARLEIAVACIVTALTILGVKGILPKFLGF